MRRPASLFSVIAVYLLCVPIVAHAQEKENPTSFVYATYFECAIDMQWRADEIADNVFAPVYNAAVEDGTITSWGWAAHHTGGKWRRILFYSAPTVDALLDAAKTINAKTQEANRNASNEFGGICGPHDDYIWQVGSSSRGAGIMPQERGKAGFSVYLDCEMNREDRADEIVEEVYAPIYNRQVANGEIASWGWLKHFIGGEWRRLATMTGKDHKSLLAARSAVIQEINDKHEAAGNEFSEICDEHQDYLWNFLHESP